MIKNEATSKPVTQDESLSVVFFEKPKKGYPGRIPQRGVLPSVTTS
jgi:hypothetical protein